MPKGLPKNGINKGWFKKGSTHQTLEATKLKIGLANTGHKVSEETREKIRNKNKGKRFSINTEFKKGLIPWSAGKKCPQISNENHYNWKGDTIGNDGVHHWVVGKKGKASEYICEICKEKQAQEWSNKDHSYKRNLEDYTALCRSCHRKYDYARRRFTTISREGKKSGN